MSLMFPSAGSARILGEDISNVKMRSCIGRQFGFRPTCQTIARRIFP
ncbi:MAG: hypothetical protein ABI686_06960 [Acidobacteriota bacterium]